MQGMHSEIPIPGHRPLHLAQADLSGPERRAVAASIVGIVDDDTTIHLKLDVAGVLDQSQSVHRVRPRLDTRRTVGDQIKSVVFADVGGAAAGRGGRVGEVGDVVAVDPALRVLLEDTGPLWQCRTENILTPRPCGGKKDDAEPRLRHDLHLPLRHEPIGKRLGAPVDNVAFRSARPLR